MTLWNHYQALHCEPAETFSEFLFGEDYLALPESEIYPGVVEVGGEIYRRFLDNSIDAAFVLAGLGGGKSTLAALLTCAAAHWLLALGDPHEYFGLLPDKPIVTVTMGPTATQVRNVVFAGIRSFVQSSPFFNRWSIVPGPEPHEQKVLVQSITFRKGDQDLVKMLAGHSVETFPLGLNLFFGTIDEISLFKDTEDKSQAKLIFETLDQRRVSRFGDKKRKGMIVCVGTMGTEGDYVDRKMKAAQGDPRIFTHRATSWEMRGRDKYSGGAFHFVKRDLGPRGMKFECLDEPPTDKENVVLHLEDVPDAFRRVFERDPLLALRDFASIPSLAVAPWDMNASVLRRSVNRDREHPFYDGTWEPKDWFKGETGIEYVVHIDLALNRQGGGDCAGLAMGHVIGERRVEVGTEKIEREDWEGRFEFRPVIFIDLLLRISAGDAGEILFSDVRRLLYVLLELGFDIAGTPLKWDRFAKVTEFTGGITFDSYQSVDSIQLLAEHGICAGTYSVDKDTAAYELLRESIQDHRLDVYPYHVDIDGLPIELLPYEYERLELVKRGSKYVVDHAPNMHKDLADAVAAIVARLTEGYKKSRGGWI